MPSMAIASSRVLPSPRAQRRGPRNLREATREKGLSHPRASQRRRPLLNCCFLGYVFLLNPLLRASPALASHPIHTPGSDLLLSRADYPCPSPPRYTDSDSCLLATKSLTKSIQCTFPSVRSLGDGYRAAIFVVHKFSITCNPDNYLTNCEALAIGKSRQHLLRRSWRLVGDGALRLAGDQDEDWRPRGPASGSAVCEVYSQAPGL